MISYVLGIEGARYAFNLGKGIIFENHTNCQFDYETSVVLFDVSKLWMAWRLIERTEFAKYILTSLSFPRTRLTKDIT